MPVSEPGLCPLVRLFGIVPFSKVCNRGGKGTDFAGKALLNGVCVVI